MQPSEQDLQRHFGEMDDEVLLRSAEDVDDLTPSAQEIVRYEVALRRLTMPASSDAPGKPVLDERIITIRRFRDVSEAIVARGALEAADIPCFLQNENTVRIDWQISNAIGGIRLDVLESDRDAAEAALAPIDLTETDLVSANGETDAEAGSACPNCGSQDIHRKHRWGGLAMLAILTFGIPFPRGPKEWSCNTCRTRWVDNERD